MNWGPLKDWAINLFDKKNSERGLIDGNIARETLDEHLQGKRNWDHRLWPILMWQQWNLERFNLIYHENTKISVIGLWPPVAVAFNKDFEVIGFDITN